MVVVMVVEEISAKSSFSSSSILKVTSETRRYHSYLGEKRRHKHTPWHYRAQHEEAPKYINTHTHTHVLLK